MPWERLDSIILTFFSNFSDSVILSMLMAENKNRWELRNSILNSSLGKAVGFEGRGGEKRTPTGLAK